MRLPKQSRWPLQKVVEREQVFKSSEEYPDGYVLERLFCGHYYRENIAVTGGRHHPHAKMRRCRECMELVVCREAIPMSDQQQAEAPAPPEARWQPIETAPKGRVIIGALIRDGRVWRVHDMKHNGLAFYTVNGGSLPQMTHWIEMPLPESPR